MFDLNLADPPHAIAAPPIVEAAEEVAQCCM